jgi:hypothetical protein
MVHDQLGTRGSAQYAPHRQSGYELGAILGSASVISDEDIARQSMRLGDASNFSTYGHNSIMP